MDAAGNMELLGKGQRTLLLLMVKAVTDTLFLCHAPPPPAPQALQRTHCVCLYTLCMALWERNTEINTAFIMSDKHACSFSRRRCYLIPQRCLL